MKGADKNSLEKFGMQNSGKYHDLYVQSDTLLLADLFKRFRNKCVKIHERQPADFCQCYISMAGICLKKT